MPFLKNYFYIFASSYATLFITKVLFAWYLRDTFDTYSWMDLLYAILWGYKFDVAMAAIIALLVSFADWHKKTMFYLASFLIVALLLAQVSDIMYFYESSRHIGYEVKDAAQDIGGLLVTAYTQHTLLSLAALGTAWVLYFILVKLFRAKCTAIKLDRAYLGKKVFLIVLSVFLIRGMFVYISLNPWQSNQIGDVNLSALALNGTYNTIFSFLNSSGELKSRDFGAISEDEIQKTFDYLYNENEAYNLTPKKRNIVFLFLESWSAVNIQHYGFVTNTTPFFNSILKKSIRPKAMIANGHRTTEGVFAALASFQNPLGETIAKTSLQDYSYRSIIDILKEHGYASAFFQGSSKETSGTGSFVQSLGFEQSYGKRDISFTPLGHNEWGVYDQDLYRFTLEKVAKLQEPFVIGINGATTHDDKVPEGTVSQKFIEDKTLNRQMNALYSSDKALEAFVTEVEDRYPNTLFVFFADHCGSVKSSSMQNYLIPFALYAKDLSPSYKDVYLSQRDIAPTLLDVTLGDYRTLAPHFSGKSLVRDKRFFADYYHNGILGWIEGKRLVEINIVSNNFACFDVNDLRPKSVSCTAEDKAQKQRAKVFTIYAQKLLFEGKVKRFASFRKTSEKESKNENQFNYSRRCVFH